MKIRIIASLVVLAISLPAAALAEGDIKGWFDPQPEMGMAFELTHGTDIVISGTNLTGTKDYKQNLPVTRQLCFVSQLNENDQKCYKQNDPIIKSWSANNITLSAPEDIFPSGSITLRFESEVYKCTTSGGNRICGDVLEWSIFYRIGTFKMRPVIESVKAAGGSVVNGILTNSTYEVEGVWFGTGKGNLYIDDAQISATAIESWLPNKIVFKSDALAGNAVRVQNGNAYTQVFDLTKQQLSSRTSSASSASSSRTVSVRVFSDVSDGFYASKEIIALNESGIIQGYSDGTFRPNETVNRAELIKLLIAGLHVAESKNERDCFPDVKAEWFSTFVCAAKRLNWISGYSDGSFKPSNTVNRAEAIKMIVSSLTDDMDSTAALPVDVSEDDWFAPYVRKAVELGIVRDSLFNPGANLLRADAAIWIYRGTTN